MPVVTVLYLDPQFGVSGLEKSSPQPEKRTRRAFCFTYFWVSGRGLWQFAFGRLELAT